VSPLSRRFLFTAAAFLGGGLALGLWMLIGRDLRGIWPAPYLVSAHTHLLLVGTILSTILGTALWLFPRPLKADLRVRAWHGEAAYWCLTVGTLARAVGEIARTSSDAAAWPIVTVIGGSLQLLGMGCGVLALRVRIRPSAGMP
jgi:hypothetical protein